jgi:hypothetical protein
LNKKKENRFRKVIALLETGSTQLGHVTDEQVEFSTKADH